MRTIKRILLAVIAGAFIIGTAGMGSASAATASHPPNVTTHWPHAFQLMAHHGYWCAEPFKSAELKCAYWDWRKMPLDERLVHFRGAMRALRDGRAVTRIAPHYWLWVYSWL